MNTILSPQDVKEERLAGNVDIPAAGEALRELEAVRAAAARAQAKIDAAAAVAAQWDQFKRWRVELKTELAALTRHFEDVQAKFNHSRPLVLKSIAGSIFSAGRRVSEYALLEKILELIPDAIEEKERELKEVQDEMLAFADTHHISARIEDEPPPQQVPENSGSAAQEPAITAAAVPAGDNDTPAAAGPGQDVDDDAAEEKPDSSGPPLRGSRR